MSAHDGFLPSLAWQSMTPELVVLLFALLAPIVALWDTDRKGMQQFSLIGLGGAFLLTLGSLFGWNWDIPGTGIDFTLEYIGSNLKGAFVVTEASQIFKLIFLGVAFAAVLGSERPLGRNRRVTRSEEDHGEFYSLILFATLGMMVVASSRELFTLFLGIETASLSSYLLAGFRRDSRGAEAALKYFTIGAIASGMVLFAISLIYGMTGTTYIAGIGDALATDGPFDAMTVVASILLLAGLGFKISSIPTHAWAPDVYHGAPVPVAGMLAAASKAMGFVAVFNVFLVALAGVAANWQLAVAAVAVVTMFVGNLVALQQKSIVRMLAYSSIAQAGYILIAVVVAGAVAATGPSATYAVGGGVLHLMVNAAMKLGAFLIIGALIWAGIPDTTDGYRGLARRAPFLAFAMTIFLLSMAGLPPLGGFTSKFVLFSSAVDVGITKHLGWLIWLAVFAVLNSAISLFYYLRVIRNMYVEGERETGSRIAASTGTYVAVGICLIAVLLIGLYPAWFVDAAMDAAAGLLEAGAAGATAAATAGP